MTRSITTIMSNRCDSCLDVRGRWHIFQFNVPETWVGRSCRNLGVKNKRLITDAVWLPQCLWELEVVFWGGCATNRIFSNGFCGVDRCYSKSHRYPSLSKVLSIQSPLAIEIIALRDPTDYGSVSRLVSRWKDTATGFIVVFRFA